MSNPEIFYGSGGRKRSTARVFLVPTKQGGLGEFTVNKKAVADYFPEIAAVDKARQPLSILGLNDLLNQYHIKATVKGGGKTGQRDAICLGLANALVMLEEKKPGQVQSAQDISSEEEGRSEAKGSGLVWRRKLRKTGMLTRDNRRVEAKRYGLHKARKRAPHVKR